MNKLLIMIMSVVHLCVFAVGIAVCDQEYERLTNRWLMVLKKGDNLEKSLALNSLYLKYYEADYGMLLEGLFRSLRDKNASVRLSAVDALIHFGRTREELFSGNRYTREGLKRELDSKDTITRKVARKKLADFDARYKIVPELIKSLSDSDPKVRANAAVALLEYKDERSIDALIKSLRDPDPWVRLNAVYTLGKMRAQKSVDGIVKLLSEDNDWRSKYVQQEAVQALSSMGIQLGTDVRKDRAELMQSGPPLPKPGQGLDAIDAENYVTPEAKEAAKKDELLAKNIISAFIKKSKDPYVRRPILEIFGRYLIQEGREVVVEAATDQEEMIRKTALESLARLDKASPRPGDTWQPAIRRAPSTISQKRTQRTTGAEENGAASSKDEAFNIFKTSLSDPSADIRAGAAKGLGNLRDPRGIDLLIAALNDSASTVRMNVATGLGKMGDSKVVDPLITLSKDVDVAVRKTAIDALGNFSENRILDVLALYLNDDKQGLIRSSQFTLTPRTFHESVLNSFISVATRGKEKNVYVYRKNGVRYITTNASEGSMDRDSGSRLVHPYAVKLLIDHIENVEKNTFPVFELLARFEDPRIEKLMLKILVQRPSQAVIQYVPATCGASAVPRLIQTVEKGEPALISSAIQALGPYEDEKALKLIVHRLHDKNDWIRSSALSVLNRYADSDALSNVGKETVSTLIRNLRDPNAGISSVSAKALGTIHAAEAVDPLISILEEDFELNPKESFRKREIIISLRKIGDRKAVPMLIKMFTLTELQGVLIDSYGALKDPRAVDTVEAYLKSEDSRFRYEAIKALGAIGDNKALNILVSLLDDNVWRDKAVSAIGNISGDRAYNILVEKLADKDDKTSNAAENALGKRKDKRPLRLLLRNAGRKPERAPYIAHTLKYNMLAENKNVVLDYLDDSDKDVRKGAIHVVSIIGDTSNSAKLTKYLKDPDGDIRAVAEKAISFIERRKIDEKALAK